MSLSLTVHRGTRQIGGTCIEIRHSDGARLILDAGLPLDAPREATGLLPASLDLDRPATILICHPHQDHWGLLHELPDSWPVLTGPISEKLIRLGYEMNGKTIGNSISPWDYRKPFQIGPFTIEAWLTDHSAPDAAMLLVEADGKRIFYTGDFRKHGREGALVARLMADPPRNVDVMIMEGTNIGTDKPTVTEEEIEERLVDLLDVVPGRVFVYWSAQNVDRTVSLFRAARRRRRSMFVDLYAAEVMDLVAPGTRLPSVTREFPELRLVVTGGQRAVRRRNADLNRRTDALIERCKSSGQAIAASHLPEDAIVMIRDSSLRDFDRAGIRPGTNDAFVFSAWSGYAQTIAARSFRLMKEAGARIEHIHTSGHASTADIRALIEAVEPLNVVPVHGENWDRHAASFPRILRLSDGEVHSLA